MRGRGTRARHKRKQKCNFITLVINDMHAHNFMDRILLGAIFVEKIFFSLQSTNMPLLDPCFSKPVKTVGIANTILINVLDVCVYVCVCHKRGFRFVMKCEQNTNKSEASETESASCKIGILFSSKRCTRKKNR